MRPASGVPWKIGVQSTGSDVSRMPFRPIEPTGIAFGPIEPTGIEPTGIEPTGIEPTGIEPTGIDPTGIEPTGIEPTGIEPTGIEPTGIEPTGAESGEPENEFSWFDGIDVSGTVCVPLPAGLEPASTVSVS